MDVRMNLFQLSGMEDCISLSYWYTKTFGRNENKKIRGKMILVKQ